jgi:chromosome segregation ATPase
MERHGIEWEDKGTHDKHLSVLDFKKEQRAKEIAELEAVKAKKQGQVEQQEQRLKELVPAVRNMEQLAARFSDDPERILPEPGPLESAKSYREKKAKPLLAKIVKVLRSVYRAYLDLKSDLAHLQGQYNRAVSRCNSFSARLNDVLDENKTLRERSMDYERVRRAIGPEQADRILEAAHQQEQPEKERKRATKQKVELRTR